MTTEQFTTELELLIDKAGMVNALESLATICREKADHLRSNRQDEKSAKAFEKLASKLDKASASAAREMY